MIRPALLAACLALTGCSLFTPSVTRRVHGETTEGRYVSEDAYEASFLGAAAEQQGNFAEAETHLRRAVRHDPASGDLWSRLGAVVCKRGGEAESLFERAAKEERSFAPTYERWAACVEARGDRDRAASLRARAADPAR